MASKRYNVYAVIEVDAPTEEDARGFVEAVSDDVSVLARDGVKTIVIQRVAEQDPRLRARA